MKKPRSKKSQRSRHQRFDFQNLEPRKLMASLTGGADLDSADTPATPSLIQQADQQEAFQGPVQRIVNGEQTDGFEAVGFVGPLGCTGTLISPTHVLTAAHCLEGVGNTQAFFQVNGQTYQSSKVTIHENYNPNQFDVGYDLAIIELDRPVLGVDPMQINRTVPQVGTMLTLVGFGEGGTSQDGFDPNDTGKQVGQTELEVVTDQHISWNFDSHDEANTAPGDSGGPAFIEVDGQMVIAGVTSGGQGVAQELGDFSFDTRIDVHADWIDNIVNGDSGPEPGGDDHANTPGASATGIQLNNGSGNATGVLETAGDRDAFQFTLTEAGPTKISVNETGSGLDTYLRVYDASGNLIHENDDAGGTFNSEVVATLEAGTYFATVGAYSDSGTGSFALNVEHEANTSTGEYSTFTNNNSKPISENGRDRVVSFIDVSGLSGDLTDLNVEVDIQHTWVGDLRLVLVAPDKTRIVLVNRQGEDGDDFDQTVFDQQAAQHINRGDAPFRGTFRPTRNLDNLNGMDPNGRWKLVVFDFADGDGGSLDGWKLDIATDAPRSQRIAANNNWESGDRCSSEHDQQTDSQRQRRHDQLASRDLGLAASIDSTEHNVDSDNWHRPGHSAHRHQLLDSVFGDAVFAGIDW